MLTRIRRRAQARRFSRVNAAALKAKAGGTKGPVFGSIEFEAVFQIDPFLETVTQIQIEFVVSAYSPRDFPRAGEPEIVLAGRSNVGKSSLINKLVGMRGLARTSSTPGKTRSINFYRCGGSFFLADLPGFGYAKGKSESRQWKQLIEAYFKNRSAITLVIHLVDARLAPTALDVQFDEWLKHMKIPRLVVATKSDKLSGNQRAVQMRLIHEYFPDAPVIFASSVTGTGCKEIWNRVAEAAQYQ